MNSLVNDLTTAIQERGWSMRELARRSGVSSSLVSLVLSGQTPATADFCVKVSRALGWNKEETLRAAGILDPLPEPVADEHRALALYRQLDVSLRCVIQQTMKAMLSVRSLSLPPAPTDREILDSWFDEATPDQRDEVIEFFGRAQRDLKRRNTTRGGQRKEGSKQRQPAAN